MLMSVPVLCPRRLQIVYVKIPPGRGCGFVQYVSRASAEEAISAMQGGDVNGCKVWYLDSDLLAD